MKTKILLASAALLAALSACSVNEVKNIATGFGGRTPSGKITEKTWQFDDIKGIESASGVVVHYTQQATTAPVRVSAPEDVLKKAVVRMTSGGTLEIQLESGTNFRFGNDEQRLHAYVAAPSVSDFEAYSGSEIIVADTLNIYSKVEAESHSGATISFSTLISPKVEFSSSSGSSIDAEAVTAEKFEADASSGSNISASGTATEVDLEASSGASVDCRNLKAERGKASANSGGGIQSNIATAEIERSSGGRVKNSNN